MPSSQSAATTTRTPVPVEQASRLVGRGAEHHRDRVAAAVAQGLGRRARATDSPASSTSSALGPPIRAPGPRREQQAVRGHEPKASAYRSARCRDQGALRPQTLTTPPLAQTR